MTVTDELHTGMLEFTHLKQVEFLEFIGRIAHLFFEPTSHHYEWKITQKIEVILTWMFKVDGLVFQVPPEREDFLSDSDDDYWLLLLKSSKSQLKTYSQFTRLKQSFTFLIHIFISITIYSSQIFN